MTTKGRGLPIEAILQDFRGWWASVGNYENPALVANWRQMLEVYNLSMEQRKAWGRSGSGECYPWHVLTPHTGTGKTELLKFALAHLPESESALVVVPMIDDAEDGARDVRERSGRPESALAVHSKAHHSTETSRRTQVIFTPHACMEKGLKRGLVEARIGWMEASTWGSVKWESLHHYKGKLRSLCVVDETFPMFEVPDIDLQSLRFMLSDIAHRVQFPEIVLPCLKVLLELQESLDNSDGPKEAQLIGYDNREELLPQDEHQRELIDRFLRLDPQHLLKKKDFEGADSTRFFGTSGDKSWSERWHKRSIDILEAAQDMFGTFLLYSPKGASGRSWKSLLSTVSCLVQLGVAPGVLLDGTGVDYPPYTLLSDRIKVHTRIPGGRSHAGNTLRPAVWDFGTGKHSSIKNAPTTFGPLMESIRRQCTVDGPRLYICHKGARAVAEEFLQDDEQVAHWGAIAGTNDFREFAVVAELSLPHREPHHLQLAALSARGIRPENKKDLRPLMREMVPGLLAAEMAQAMNRGRCRKVVDTEGRGQPTEWFCPLPRIHAKSLLSLLKSHLPGCGVKPWDTGLIGLKESLTTEDLLKRQFLQLPVGRTEAADVMAVLGVGKRQMKRLLSVLKDSDSPLALWMREAGVRLNPGSQGRGNSAYFERRAG